MRQLLRHQRCADAWSDVRCQLRAGHASAHAARQDGALISWRSEQHGDRLVLDWADPDGEEPAGGFG